MPKFNHRLGVGQDHFSSADTFHGIIGHLDYLLHHIPEEEEQLAQANLPQESN